MERSFDFRLLANGIIEFRPKKKNSTTKAITLSCGIHGNETAPIEILDEIIRDIFNGKITINHELLFIFGNPKAMIVKKRFLYENLNRLFNMAWKKKEKNYEIERAKEIEKHVYDFFSERNNEKIHYDLHTAIKPSIHERFAIYPYIHERDYDSKQLQFLKGCAVTNILLSNGPTTTFSYFSSYNFNAHSFTIELGKVKDFGKNDRNDFLAVDNSLRELISKEELKQEKYNPNDFNVYKVVSSIVKNSEDFEFLVDDTKNFISFPKGTKISKDKNELYITEHDDERIVFPNKNVALGQRAALMVTNTKIK